MNDFRLETLLCFIDESIEEKKIALTHVDNTSCALYGYYDGLIIALEEVKEFLEEMLNG